MSDVLSQLLEALGPDVVSTGDAIPARYRHDWSGLAPVLPLALLRPRNTEEVSKALAICNATGTPVTPQGGLTGISGGAHPDAAAVSLSLDRMNRIEGVDPEMATLTVEAGVILQAAQAAAAEAGLMLGYDLGARGSCTVGGTIATNAGGNQVIRYGMAREHILGLEVVLADGTVVNAMNRMIKNNAGLDTKQLFIGSEGLLGVVTRAVLRLQPRPPFTATAFCGCPDLPAGLRLLTAARKALGPALTSFEVMWPSFYHFMSDGTHQRRILAEEHGIYVIVEASAFTETAAREMLETCLGAAMEEGDVADAVLAASGKDERALWAVRESVAEYPNLMGPINAFDIGIPLERMAEAVAALESGLKAKFPDAITLSYGHIGDSNLHLVVNVPSAGRQQPDKEIKGFVYGMTRDLAGTISAEHGLGLIKRAYLGYSRSPEEIALMHQVKAALDPNNILNPTKAFA
ncbi:FAD-binding oxidoreductase [Paroceanicella profunda]|uniref:FAD-binding oxidoreductase n=1 Tax=Paroceanicella profunda TaxID=2579971 RepID=A0A5B8FVJ3_9RHOB|nr:FAD-binding oxidoreductase [Paroceanicella profunda]QDL90332.1 FAD-binding oxidoreductase [Paroceanicella profunda]